ncbi:STAS domain-containing protein [Paracraurococcus lichenis]|uniref:STAS domain-containing protein n=1 Tax=Paracraurococcus lichenis TaxID=3064888 RepID=A0ABT9EAF9_9PROT|nr:STAS domain-containing protein [Paracraurococcus sp. LOR1-02]MDO9712958.1 STAS domain-containing protein [Paracraurococcus sp. LOR1-02]
MAALSILAFDGILVVALPKAIDDRTMDRLAEEVGNRLVELAASAVLIDVSLAQIIDSFLGRVLAGLAATSRLLGAEVVLVGVRPEVAITMVELGLDLGNIATALTIEQGLANIRARLGGSS